MKKQTEPVSPNAVSQMYTFRLGGYMQKVLIEGKYKTLPIVIVLHGGPGTPIPFNAGCRGLFPDFTDRFLMVYWDQLGCGINNCPLDEELSIRSFRDMTLDLIREVRILFPGNLLFLFSMSWGTVLSAQAAAAAPELVDGVVAWGQVTHRLLFNEKVRSALEASSIPFGKLDRVRQIEPRMLCPEDLQFYTGCLKKYTQGYENRQGTKPSLLPILKGMLKSPDYRLRDLKALAFNGYTRSSLLIRELLSLDLRDILSRTQVPYHILQGDTDLITPTDYVQTLVETAGNPLLSCQVVKNSGHQPCMEAMNAILEALIRRTA